jgi:hypothetical protein
METIEDNLSYFKYPISNTIPEKTLSLEAVTKIVMLGELKNITKKVRAKVVDKTDKLPYITSSGCFYSRNDDDIVSYSGIVCIDLDDIENVSESQGLASPILRFRVSENQHISTSAHQHIDSLKHMLFEDHFLKPAFIFVSPSGNGLKLFIRIKNADSSFHNDYFNAISLYLFNQYNLTADSSCRNISRACLLCHDPEALWSPFTFVLSEDLLKYIPPRPPESPAFLAHFKKLYAHFNYDPDFRKHESNKLNCLDAVHERAESALLSNGWTRTGIFFTRPGKAGGKTASFCVPPGYKIFIFYNFSSNASPFLPKKGYTDCQVISLLEFGDDYGKCISALSEAYKDEIDASNQHISTSAHQHIDDDFNIRDICVLMDDGEKRTMPRKIIGAFLYEDTTTLLFSRTNYGKSLLVFQFAFAAATGTDFDSCAALCNECEPMKVLVIDLELNDGILWNRHGIIKSNPHPYMRNLKYVHEKIEKKVSLGFDLIDKIEHAAIAHQAKLVIIDNISKLLPDALRPDTATMVIAMLNRIRILTGASILVIGHTTKGNPRVCIQPTDYYGSAMLQNFFNELSFLDMTKDENFFLCHSKTKYRECYNQTVPVFFRGDQSRVGVGFTFCNLQNLADIQLPFALELHKTTRRDLSKYVKQIHDLYSSGSSIKTISEIFGVSHTAISRYIHAA